MATSHRFRLDCAISRRLVCSVRNPCCGERPAAARLPASRKTLYRRRGRNEITSSRLEIQRPHGSCGTSRTIPVSLPLPAASSRNSRRASARNGIVLSTLYENDVYVCMCMYVRMYMYTCICVCVCVCRKFAGVNETTRRRLN